MRVIFKGYDPDLGKRFAEETGGLVIGRSKPTPAALVEECADDIAKPMPGESAQEMHDRLLMDRQPVARPATR